MTNTHLSGLLLDRVNGIPGIFFDRADEQAENDAETEQT